MRAIVLAHAKDFSMGPVSVQPSIRTIGRDDRRAVLEPRVMQVLVALAKHSGEVVSRDDLVEACWNGRIVGDDAVNRVIGRLRRTADDFGADVFAIDTITRVGYRLRPLQGGEPSELQARPRPSVISRRGLIAGGGVLAVAAGSGWLVLRRRWGEATVSPESAAMLQQAKVAQWQSTREGQNQAIGLYRQVVTREPNYADGWGYLATAYAWTAHYRRSDEAAMLRERARAAAAQAFSLDAGNPLAQLGAATARPFLRNWLAVERALRDAVSKRPENDDLSFSLALLLGSTGRGLEALKYMKFVLPSGPTPGIYFYQAQLLWTAGRMEDLDNLFVEARRLYPTHFALWFMRFYSFIFSGRAEEAIALSADTPNRPTGIDPEEIAAVTDVARALAAPSPSATAKVVDEWMRRARSGAGYAENAAQFMTALGRIDEAFAVLRAYYFSEGFDCGEIRFSASQGTYTAHNDRLTWFLFNPALAPLRADRRFRRLVNDLGLVEFWRASGRWPDYRPRPA
jgi:DNA-binding winged helix-turn-helix (wHTH) protein/tetratricopeptide (TPR) repeat protein